MPNNSQRADWARFALDAFAEAMDDGTRNDIANGCLEAPIMDLIADLLHLAEREGIDADALLQSAQNHFHCEGGAGNPKDDIATSEDERAAQEGETRQ